MPLGKPFRRSPDGPFYIRGTVRGQSVYESTGTSDPDRAALYRSRRETELWDGSIFGKKAVITFASAAESYLNDAPRSQRTGGLVVALIKHLGTVHLGKINQDTLDGAYRALLTARAGPATKQRSVLTPLRAIMEHAAVRGWCARPAFAKPKIGKSHTPYLRPTEATALVHAAAPHLRPLLVFLIGTGCRMSEALELEWDKVDLRGRRATVLQKQGTERHVELAPVVMAALTALPEREGAVFRPKRCTGKGQGRDGYRSTGRTGGGQIKTAWASACARAGLPGEWREFQREDRPSSWRRFSPVHNPHATRHTWASWHYCQHKDLLRLQEDGGWETVSMVTRYAKRVPDAYREEIAAWLAGGVLEHPIRAPAVQGGSAEPKSAVR